MGKGWSFTTRPPSACSRFLTTAGGTVATIEYEGTPDHQQVTPDGKRLVLHDIKKRQIAVAAPGADKAAVFTLPAEFNAFIIAPDSKAVVVFHGGTSNAGSLVNTAEVGLLDIDAPASKDNPRVATITGLSRVPLRAHVSTEIDVSDGVHRVVWIDAASMIGVADFGPGGRVRTLVIPLVASDSAALITPLATVARASAGKLELYVIATGSNDVLHITMDLGAAEFGATLDQIASGAKPLALHVYDGAGGVRVLTTNFKSRDVAVLDPTTGTGTYVHLDVLTTRIVPFTATADGSPRALLWSEGLSDFHLVDLDRVAKKKGKAVKRVHLDQPIRAVTAADDRFIFRHDSADRGLSLYDAAAGKQTVFGGTGKVSQVVPVGGAIYALGDAGGSSRVSRIDLADLHGTSITLNYRLATSLLPFGKDGIAAAGPGLGGWWLALFGKGLLSEKDGTWLEGFALEGVL